MAQARRQQKSVSQLLRDVIDAQREGQVRGRCDDPLFRLVGLGRDPARDVAERHDHYLYRASPKRRLPRPTEAPRIPRKSVLNI